VELIPEEVHDDVQSGWVGDAGCAVDALHEVHCARYGVTPGRARRAKPALGSDRWRRQRV
jgi:hypothetical protein